MRPGTYVEQGTGPCAGHAGSFLGLVVSPTTGWDLFRVACGNCDSEHVISAAYEIIS